MTRAGDGVATVGFAASRRGGAAAGPAGGRGRSVFQREGAPRRSPAGYFGRPASSHSQLRLLFAFSAVSDDDETDGSCSTWLVLLFWAFLLCVFSAGAFLY